jgi:Zn-dependent protease
VIHPSSAFDTLKTGNRRTLFSFFDVPWTITDESWQFITSRFFMGILIAFIFLRESTISEKLLSGLVFGLLIGVSNVLHIFGHWIGGKLVNAPMDENLIPKYSIMTAYHENPDEVPGRVHFVRAIGGPLMTLAASVAAFIAWKIWGGQIPGFLAALNLLLGTVVLLPIPNADGEVIWREVCRFKRSQ